MSWVDAVVVPPEQVESVEEYDAVVIGSAIYVGHWLAPAREFARRHAAALERRPVWLFSSGPAGDPPAPAGDPTDIPELVRITSAREHRVFAGRIDRHRLGIGERLAVAAVHAPDGDFRSPADIGMWAAHIARELREPALAG